MGGSCGSGEHGQGPLSAVVRGQGEPSFFWAEQPWSWPALGPYWRGQLHIQAALPAKKIKTKSNSWASNQASERSLKWSESITTDTATAKLGIYDIILSDIRFQVICNHFGVLKTNPFHMVADWAAGQMWHCCGVWERRDRGGDKVIQRSVNQDGRAGGKPHPPHSSSIKTETEEDVDKTNIKEQPIFLSYTVPMFQLVKHLITPFYISKNYNDVKRLKYL